MKRFSILILSLFIISSCSNSGNKNIDNNILSNTRIDSSQIYKEDAISLLDEMDVWMKKGITKQIPPSEVRAVVDPLMDKYTRLMSKLNSADSTVVHEYNLEQINKMIDLQVLQMQQ